VEDGGGGGKGASRAAALWLLPLTACTHQYGSSPYRVHAPALHGASGRLPACVSWKLCLGLPLVLDRVGRWGVCGLEEIRFGVYFGLPLLLFNSYIALTIFVFSNSRPQNLYFLTFSSLNITNEFLIENISWRWINKTCDCWI
jgi:hypothetical protein